jgi:isopenicillin-N epimerase
MIANGSLKSQFALNPDIIHLNHGSFGATLIPVLEALHDWQLRLEAEPVRFLARDLWRYLAQARQELGSYLNVPPNSLAFIPNATYGVNIVARSIHLNPGDEILGTNHEYGACQKTFEYVCRSTNAHYRIQPISVPANSVENIVDDLWRGVTKKTKLMFISHISSPTAIHLPIAEICRRAREAGILTLIDGAHAPGQINVDLSDIDADYYTGNCHKWMLGPKGSGFLYTKPEWQDMIEPLVVSWGWQADPEFSTGSQYLDHLQWMGTDDPSPFLAVPAAIEFMKLNNWPEIQRRCQQLLFSAVHQLEQHYSTANLSKIGAQFNQQMAAIELPEHLQMETVKTTLYEKYNIEVYCYQWEGKNIIRVSIQAYNTVEDIEKLLAALDQIIYDSH